MHTHTVILLLSLCFLCERMCQVTRGGVWRIWGCTHTPCWHHLICFTCVRLMHTCGPSVKVIILSASVFLVSSLFQVHGLSILEVFIVLVARSQDQVPEPVIADNLRLGNTLCFVHRDHCTRMTMCPLGFIRLMATRHKQGLKQGSQDVCACAADECSLVLAGVVHVMSELFWPLYGSVAASCSGSCCTNVLVRLLVGLVTCISVGPVMILKSLFHSLLLPCSNPLSLSRCPIFVHWAAGVSLA